MTARERPLPTANEIYDSAVRSLPPSERLRLAALILDELSQTAGAALDTSEPWSAEDERDVTEYVLRHAAATYPEDEELV
jgi:hypothetical protein